MEKVRYAEMLPHEIVARRGKFPAAFVPLGGLEWHSEHMAVGNDALKAESLCDLAAGASGGFAMPTLWYGEPRSAGLLEANVRHQPAVLELMDLPKRNFSERQVGRSRQEQIEFYTQVVYHLLVQMNQLGMKAVCLVSGHYPLKGMADPAIKRFRRVRRYRGTRAYCGIEPQYHQPENRAKVWGDHAAMWETSYLAYLRPDCLDMSVYLGRDEEQELVGTMGRDPRKFASVELGRKACKLIVRGMVLKARQLIAEVDGR